MGSVCNLRLTPPRDSVAAPIERDPMPNPAACSRLRLRAYPTVLWTVTIALLPAGITHSTPPSSKRDTLAKALTFHASYDTGVDADFALGDRRLHTTPSGKPDDGRPGLLRDDIRIAPKAGRFGGAARFGAPPADTVKERTNPKAMVYYPGAKNVAYATRNWNLTVSFWLKLDPDKDLKPGYCDPIQITDKKWDDASLFVDFTQKPPREFRLGAFADHKTWNPDGRKFDDIPEAERPLRAVKRSPFTADRWVHVVMTISGFNPDSEGSDAEAAVSAPIAKLYLDGQEVASLKDRRQVFTWNMEKTRMLIGINYTGLFDDLALFDRALSAAEVKALHELKGGVKELGAG